VSFDRAFREVIAGCAEPRADQTPLTWISREVMEAYSRLHDLGHAHSVEVWAADGRLVGGLYGVAVGGVFFAESQFARERDASKVALAALCRHWVLLGGRLVDCKQPSPHLARLGARLISRATFMDILRAVRDAAMPPLPQDVGAASAAC
jgi:leucyl/phenylalanyl-tRNA--protein transferase